jgi:hypothetical protein
MGVSKKVVVDKRVPLGFGNSYHACQQPLFLFCEDIMKEIKTMKETISVITHPKDCFYVSNYQLKNDGPKNAIFFAFLFDYQCTSNPKKLGPVFSCCLTHKEMAEETGMSIHQVKSCIKYWKKKGALKFFKIGNKTYYQLNIMTGGYFNV